MKRYLILTAAIVALCLFALWLRGGWLSKDYKLTSRAPIDVIIDHMPYCAQSFTMTGHTASLTGVERGVCTSKNVRSNP